MPMKSAASFALSLAALAVIPLARGGSEAASTASAVAVAAPEAWVALIADLPLCAWKPASARPF